MSLSDTFLIVGVRVNNAVKVGPFPTSQNHSSKEQTRGTSVRNWVMARMREQQVKADSITSHK
jgi:hypothetical protein